MSTPTRFNVTPPTLPVQFQVRTSPFGSVNLMTDVAVLDKSKLDLSKWKDNYEGVNYFSDYAHLENFLKILAGQPVRVLLMYGNTRQSVGYNSRGDLEARYYDCYGSMHTIVVLTGTAPEITSAEGLMTRPPVKDTAKDTSEKTSS